jgi:uncharacterized protein
MSPLTSSIIALVVGPLFLASASPKSRVLSFVDAFVVVTLGGVALLHILPHAVLESGAWVLLAASAGLAIPIITERLTPTVTSRKHLAPVAAIAIAIHAFIDGSMLGESNHLEAFGDSSFLAAGIVLHRLPEGLAVWWLVKPRRGSIVAWLSLALVAAATAIGATAGDRALSHAPMGVVSLVEAFIAGALLHVLAHHAPHSSDRAAAGHAGLIPTLGAVVGVATLAGISHDHPVAKRLSHEVGMGATFLTLALASAPALLTSYVAVALAHALLPARSLAWVTGGATLAQSARAIVLAPLLPACSYADVPPYKSLVARGIPRAAALSALVAAPEIGFTPLLLSISLLGGPVTAARAACAIVAALVVGYVGSKSVSQTETSSRVSVPSDPGLTPFRERLHKGIRYGLAESIDHTAPWILFGLLIAAFVEPTFRGTWLVRMPPPFDVPLFALIGIPIYVRSGGAIPIMAIFLHKGLSSGAAIAFLLAGSTTNIPTLAAISRFHGRTFATAFAIVILVASVVLGFSVNYAFPSLAIPELHDAADRAPHLVQVASLVILSALLIGSLFRRGPRGLVPRLSSGHNGNTNAEAAVS